MIGRIARSTLLAVTLLAAGAARAQVTYTWNGPANGAWSTAGNWTPAGGPPTGIDTAVFTGTQTPVLTANAAIARVNKSGVGTTTISSPGGFTLTINGDGGGIGISRTGGNAANVLNISANVAIATAGETWNVTAATNTFSGTITGQSLVKGGGGTLVLSGSDSFSGATVNAGTLNMTGNDTLTAVTVNAGNLFLGGTNTLGTGTVTGGTLRADAEGALGTATVTMTGGTLTLNNTTAMSLPASVVANANATLRVQGGPPHTLANVTVTAGTLTFSTGNGSDLTVGNLTVDGTAIGGGGAFVLTVTGALSGSGQVRTVVLPGGASLTPGTGAPGLLVSGNGGDLSLADTTTLNFTVGTSTANVQVVGNLILDGIVNITPGPGFAAGTYTLFTVGGTITNNFLRFPDLAGFNTGYHITGGTVFLDVAVRPLAAKVARLDATFDGRRAQVTWTAGREPATLGYRLWRHDGARRVPVGPAFIEGAALRASAELKNAPTYAIEDWASPRGGTYEVEAIRMDGRTESIGTVGTRPGRSSMTTPADALSRSAPALLSRSGEGELARVLLQGDELDRRANEPSNQWRIASSMAAKVDVREAGVYRIAAETLFAAGIPVAAPLDSLKVWSFGRPVAFSALAADSRSLNAGDAIEFYATGLDQRYTDTRVYWVTSSLGAGPQFVRSTDLPTSDAGASFAETLQYQERLNRFGALKNGGNEKYFGPLVYSLPVARTFSTPALDLTASASAGLDVVLQGATKGPHAVQVSLNGVRLGTVSGTDQQSLRASFQIPSGLLVAGENTVQLVAPAQGDVSFEVSQRLTYPRLYRSIGAPFHFTAPGGSLVRMAGTGAAPLRVVDLSSPESTIAVEVSADPNDASVSLVSVPGNGQRRLYAFTDADVKVPAAVRANAPSSVNSDRADLLVIAHSSLLAKLEPLAAQRRSEGLRVALIDVEDVYDEFTSGVKDVRAIRAFLAHAWDKWSKPPQYVLLAGSATYNPRNYGGRGGVDLVPTPLVETEYMETGSDDALVDVDVPGVPAMAVGRLPLSSPDDVERAVAKTLARQLTTESSSLVFVRDQDDRVSSFSSQTTTLRNALATWTSREIARDSPPVDPTVDPSYDQDARDAATHDALIEALRAGPAAVNYFGHGEEQYWSGHILDVSDAPALSSSIRPSVLFTGTCLNGYFVDVLNSNLASTMLSAEGGGAWAVWASSAMTRPGDQPAFASQLWQAALSEGMTLGAATMRAKSTIHDPDVRATFQLFGDPSARMTPAKGSTALTSGGAISSSAATGCGTPGNFALGVLPLVALALLLATRRHSAAIARSRRR